MGIVTLSDPSGQYEAILFQEGLNQYRDLLEKGASVLVTLQANVEGEDVRARITLVEKLDEAAARIQKGLRITLHDKGPLPALSEKLKGRAEGEVTLILHLDAPGQEVEIKLPGRYPINPQTSGAIKTIPGVAEVELV
jgi:DNA polymerase-3 subunit alpha